MTQTSGRLQSLTRHFSSSASRAMAPITKECDYLVIGGGSGGLASGRRASKHGAKVIAIENQRLGGTCVNVGCVPKKVTWNAAAISETLREAKAYGFSVQQTAPFDWSGFVKKRAAYVERLNGIYARNLDNDKVELLRGTAKFLSKHEVQVDLQDGSQAVVRAKNVLIAVGGYPTLPPIEGAKEHAITSDGFFELETQPKKIAVVGAGYIGVEMAGMLHALGTEVHFLIRGDKILRSFDPLIQDKVTAEYERQGIHLHKYSQITKIVGAGNGQKTITVQNSDTKKESAMDVDTVLFAVGRKPQIDNLGVDKLGLKLDDKNHIIVDKYQNTNVENIFALGDVCDKGFELTPVAIAAGRKLSNRIFGGKKDDHLEYSNIPSVVFAHPEVGTIGLTEPEAREKYGDTIKVYQTGFTAMYYSMMEQEDKGPTAYKIICEGPNERVVGLHILGVGSSEILQGFGVAIKMGATKADFDSCVAIHPVSAEELVTMT